MTTPADTLPVNVQTTEYRVSCLPLEAAQHLTVNGFTVRAVLARRAGAETTR